MKNRNKLLEIDNIFRLNLIQNLDLPFSLRCRNHDGNRYWFLTTDIISRRTHEIWFLNYKKRENEDIDFVFIIKDRDSVKYGQISIYDINHGNKSCSLGRLFISPDHKGKGIMKKSINKICLFAKEIGLKKIHIETNKNNNSAIKIFNHFGFNQITQFENFIKMSLVF